MPFDRKEVEERGKALSKAQANNESPSTLLSLLEELRKGLQPSEEILRSTKIGVLVNRLKTHGNKDVARTAGELVSKWRQEIGKGSRHGRPSGASTPKGTQSPAPSSGGPRGGTGSPAPLPQKSKRGLEVAPEKRNAKADKVDTKVTGSPTRDACLELMYNGLSFMSEESPDDVLRVAITVEQAAYDKYKPETSSTYKEKMRSLFQNLKSKSNPQLRSRVLSGDIPPSRFVVMTHEELKSAERRAQDAKLQKENMDKAKVAQEEDAISLELVCGKCHKKKVSYTQAQTRAADEPMTTFCKCTVCGHRWKFS